MHKDTIYRQAAIDMLCSKCTVNDPETCSTIQEGNDWCEEVHALLNMPSAQPTLYGYDVEHLKLIARVLQKENLPPERVAEVINDTGRIISIAVNEYEEFLREAVRQCMT